MLVKKSTNSIESFSTGHIITQLKQKDQQNEVASGDKLDV